MSDHENSSKKPRSTKKSVRSSKASRELAKRFDASGTAVWLIDHDGKLAFFSEAVSTWLGVDTESLLGRTSVAGSPISDDPLDFLAAALSPPPGLATRGTASLRIDPPPINGVSGDALDVRFVRVGGNSPSDELAYQVLAIGGAFDDVKIDEDLQDVVAIRRHLDAWRKRHANLAAIATAGVSSASRRLRNRLQVAAATRTHIGFFGPPGSGAESIASCVHHQSAPREPIVTVEGPLMDAELLDVTLMPVVHRLTESDQATSTALVRGLDEMPAEAQCRLVELLDNFESRLRLMAICGRQPAVLREPIGDANADENYSELEDENPCGLLPALTERLSALTVSIDPLSSRVEDIPLLATAALDARRAAGDGLAESLSRAAMDALVLYPWPGNIDELGQAIDHAVRHSHQSSIGVEHLPLVIRSYRVGEGRSPEDASLRIPLDEAMRRLELRMIQDALATTDGNKAEAARRLGISRARLIRRIDDGASDQSSAEEADS